MSRSCHDSNAPAKRCCIRALYYSAMTAFSLQDEAGHTTPIESWSCIRRIISRVLSTRCQSSRSSTTSHGRLKNVKFAGRSPHPVHLFNMCLHTALSCLPQSRSGHDTYTHTDTSSEKPNVFTLCASAHDPHLRNLPGTPPPFTPPAPRQPRPPQTS